MTSTDYINALNLQPHPEGGYFAETYRATEIVAASDLPARFGGDRSFGTAIYFLLESHHYSALHRIKSDEIWHFYAGRPLEVFVITPDATLTVIRLGSNLAQGEVFQAVVPAGSWFGSMPAKNATLIDATFSLVGCTVAPGFDFADFEMGDQNVLLKDFPQHKAVIEMLSEPGFS
ncbi:hypothetical protein GCM10027592_52660 [Spirosoma flavus]